MANEKALEALARIGETEDWRQAMIRQLHNEAESRPPAWTCARSDRPLHDAICDDDQVVRNAIERRDLRVPLPLQDRPRLRDVAAEKPDHAWEPQTIHPGEPGEGKRQVVIGGAYFGDHAVLIARRSPGTAAWCTFEPNNRRAAC
jgi:hypothetical protein